jgi:hypothetical protein
MPKPRRGQIPAIRLRDARRVRDELRKINVDKRIRIVLTLIRGSFGVALRVPHDVPLANFDTVWEGVPLKTEKILPVKPRR